MNNSAILHQHWERLSKWLTHDDHQEQLHTLSAFLKTNRVNLEFALICLLKQLSSPIDQRTLLLEKYLEFCPVSVFKRLLSLSKDYVFSVINTFNLKIKTSELYTLLLLILELKTTNEVSLSQRIINFQKKLTKSHLLYPITQYYAFQFYLRNHQYEKILDVFQDHPEIKKFYALRYLECRNEINRHHWTQAEEKAEELIQENPSLIWGYFLKIQIFKERHYFKKTKRLIEDLHEKVIKSSFTYRLLGDIEFLLDHSLESLKNYQTALSYNRFNLEIWKNLGSTLLEYEEYNEVEEIIKIIHDLDIHSSYSWLLGAWFYEEQNQVEHALEILEEGLDYVLNPVELYLEQAKCYNLLQQDFKQFSILKQAIDINPHYFHARLLLGDYFLYHDDLIGAQEIFEDLIHQDPLYVSARLGLIQVYLKLDKPKPIILAEIDRLLKIEPKNVQALQLKGEYLFHEHEYPQSEQIFKQILQMTPHNISVIHYMGLINIVYHEDFQQAAQFFQDGLDKSPSNLFIALDLIKLYLNYLEDPEQAFEIIQEFWDDHSDNEELKSLMAQAQKMLDEY